MNNIHEKAPKKVNTKFNFEANGNKYNFADNSIYLFKPSSKFRQFFVRLMTHK